MRDMYHYARSSGLHVLECVMDVALAAVKREQLEEARNICALFIFSFRMLWVGIFCLQNRYKEEVVAAFMELDEVTCVKHLHDFLCYQLDLASFIACVNSGKSWRLKSSLLLSRKANTELENKDSQLDPFVENLVLERL